MPTRLISPPYVNSGTTFFQKYLIKHSIINLPSNKHKKRTPDFSEVPNSSILCLLYFSKLHYPSLIQIKLHQIIFWIMRSCYSIRVIFIPLTNSPDYPQHLNTANFKIPVFRIIFRHTKTLRFFSADRLNC